MPIKSSGGAITFSADGNFLAHNDGNIIYLYNIRTKDETSISTGLTGIVSLNLIVAEDVPKYVITTDSNGSAQIWDWATRTKIGNSISGSLKIVRVNSQDHSVIYIDPSGKLINWKWDLENSAWKELLCPLAKRHLTPEEREIYFSITGDPSTHHLACSDY
jgi:hypothetical protein